MTPPTIGADELETETLNRERAQQAERRRERWLSAVKSLDVLPDSADIAPASRRHESREIQVTVKWSVDGDTLRELEGLGFEEVVVKPAGVDRIAVKATYPLD